MKVINARYYTCSISNRWLPIEEQRRENVHASRLHRVCIAKYTTRKCNRLPRIKTFINADRESGTEAFSLGKCFPFVLSFS